MTKDEFIECAKKIELMGDDVQYNEQKFLAWQSSVIAFLSQFAPTFNQQIKVISKISLLYGLDASKVQRVHDQLQSTIQLSQTDSILCFTQPKIKPNDKLESILNNFRYVANQLKHRHANRRLDESRRADSGNSRNQRAPRRKRRSAGSDAYDLRTGTPRHADNLTRALHKIRVARDA